MVFASLKYLYSFVKSFTVLFVKLYKYRIDTLQKTPSFESLRVENL